MTLPDRTSRNLHIVTPPWQSSYKRICIITLPQIKSGTIVRIERSRKDDPTWPPKNRS